MEKAKCDKCGNYELLIGHIISVSNKKHNINVSMHLSKYDFDPDMTIDTEFGLCDTCFRSILSEIASGDTSWEISKFEEGY